MSHSTRHPRQSGRNKPLVALLVGVGIGCLIGSQLIAQRRDRDTGLIPARQATPQGMTAVHLGTQQGRASTRRPQDIVGEATHLGTGQGRRGDVHPSV